MSLLSLDWLSSSLILLACMANSATAANKTVFVFGDSWGDTGPTYRMVQDTLDQHGFPAVVKSAAVGGTSACQWAGQNSGMQLVDKARSTFPESSDGPDYVWYTLGGNDIAYDQAYKKCAKSAKVFDDMVQCLKAASSRAMKCTETMFDNYFKAFPKSRVLQSGYDLPCENLYCDVTITGSYDARWCGSNHTCLNTLMEKFHELYIGGLSQKYAGSHYSVLNLLGTSQKAGGVAGADIGKPVLSQGSPCQWTTLCVHPKYKSPPADLIGEVFWNQYFSKQTQSSSLVV